MTRLYNFGVSVTSDYIVESYNFDSLEESIEDFFKIVTPEAFPSGAVSFADSILDGILSTEIIVNVKNNLSDFSSKYDFLVSWGISNLHVVLMPDNINELSQSEWCEEYRKRQKNPISPDKFIESRIDKLKENLLNFYYLRTTKVFKTIDHLPQ